MHIHVPGHESREAVRMARQALDEHTKAVKNRMNDYRTSLEYTENEVGDYFSFYGYRKYSESSSIQNAVNNWIITLEKREDVFRRATRIVRLVDENNQAQVLAADGVIAAFGAIAGVVFVPIQMWIEHRQHQMERYKLITSERNSAIEVTYDSEKIRYANTVRAAKYKDEISNKNSLSINKNNIYTFINGSLKSHSDISVIRIVNKSDLGNEITDTYGDSYRLVRQLDGTLLFNKLSAPLVQQSNNTTRIEYGDDIATCSRIMIENDGSVKLKYLHRIHVKGSYNVLLPVENNRMHFVGNFEEYKADEKKLKWTISDRGQWLNICKCLPIYSEMFKLLDIPTDQRHCRADTVWPAQLVYVIMLLNFMCENTGAINIVSGKPDLSGINHAAISRMVEQYRGSTTNEGNSAMHFDVWTASKYSLII